MAYIYEFLFRGRRRGDPEPPAWSLQLGAVQSNPFGKDTVVLSECMSMERAKAMGWDLPQVLSAINADLVGEVEKVRKLVRDVKGHLDRDDIVAAKAAIEAP